MTTKRPRPAAYERSDVCAVPAASVILEGVVAFEVASALVERYVGTSLTALVASLATIHEISRRHIEENWATA